MNSVNFVGTHPTSASVSRSDHVRGPIFPLESGGYFARKVRNTSLPLDLGQALLRIPEFADVHSHPVQHGQVEAAHLAVRLALVVEHPPACDGTAAAAYQDHGQLGAVVRAALHHAR